MRPPLAGLAAALVFAAALPAVAQPRVNTMAIGDLVGLTPQQVRSRLIDGAEAWPLQPTFEMATPRGKLTFYEPAALVQDPEMAATSFSRRTHGDARFVWPAHLCSLTRDGAGSVERGALVFRDGRFEAAYTPTAPYPMPPLPPARTAGDVLARAERPQAPSPFLAAFGALPLTDGAGFMQRWRREPMSASDRITATCNLPPPNAPRPAGPQPGADVRASDFALLPLALIYAPIIPLTNGARGAALQRGLTQLSALKVGGPLGDTAERYAAKNKGVRIFREGDPDYAVLTLDLGGAPSRNTSDVRDAALVGVRGGVVEWISPPADIGVGPRANLLCLDRNNVAATPRKGCSGFGNYSPK